MDSKNDNDSLQREDSKNSQSTTREKVDHVMDTVGSESLQKMGVPKFIANRAIKNGGGVFSPANSPLTKNISRNALASSINNFSDNNEDEEIENDEEEFDELREDEELVNGQDLDDSNFEEQEKQQVAREVAKDIAKQKVKSEIKKKALAVAAKNPYFWIIILTIVVVIGIAILMLLVMNNDNSKKNTENNSLECSSINFYETPLSRSEFVSRATSYLAKYNSTTAQLFRNNADRIYDLGKEVGANPEMVFIIAAKEEGWNDKYFTVNCNNFYGYGVYNGQSTGTCFDSFEAGVRKILEYVKDKGSLDAFTKVYSYLGTYLANPGSWGDGGCKYLTLDDIYGPNYSRCNSSYRCASSRGGSGCVLTTDAEKQAYVDWQAKKILAHRSNIFQLGTDSCEGSSGGLEGSTEGTSFINEPISSFLAQQNTTLEAFNDKIIDQGCKYQGTGEGVAYVAATAVSELANYGKKFHYTWGGMHGAAPSNYGVPASWGTTGPDCSGFVSWALYNAGFTWKALGATGWGALGELADLGDSRARVGDFLLTPGDRGWNHIVIITSIHQSEGYYTVVHAQGTAYGIVFSKVPFTTANRKLALMSNYYNTATKSQEFSNMCLARGG